MRKRKSPIALVTMLAVVVFSIAGYNFVTSRPGGNPADQPPAPAEPPKDVKPVGAPRAAETAASVAGGVKAQIARASSTGPHGPEGAAGDPEMGPRGPRSGPLILNPAASTAKPEKPKPNSTSTSAQWYNPESSMSGK